MRRALRAEWVKLRTLPTSPWLVGAVVAATVAVGAAATASVSTANCPPSGCREDTARLALAGAWAGQVAVVALAVLVVSGEYGTGTIQATLAAVPRRGRVLAAKALVVSAVVAAAGAVGVLASLVAGRLILPGNGFGAAAGYEPLSLFDEPTRRAAVGTVAYLVLVGLLALGVGALVRDTAVSVTVVLAVLFLAPALVAMVGDESWRDRLDGFVPTTAGLAIQATTDLDRLPIAPWPGLALFTAYTAATLAAAATAFTTRDA